MKFPFQHQIQIINYINDLPIFYTFTAPEYCVSFCIDSILTLPCISKSATFQVRQIYFKNLNFFFLFYLIIKNITLLINFQGRVRDTKKVLQTQRCSRREIKLPASSFKIE